jgi:hypothetical protein
MKGQAWLGCNNVLKICTNDNVRSRVFISLVTVAHPCNPSYSGSRNQDDHSSKPARAKRAGRVAQGSSTALKKKKRVLFASFQGSRYCSRNLQIEEVTRGTQNQKNYLCCSVDMNHKYMTVLNHKNANCVEFNCTWAHTHITVFCVYNYLLQFTHSVSFVAWDSKLFSNM